MLDTVKMREKEREALEAYLGDQFAFTVPETAKALNRSAKWMHQKIRAGKLRTVWLDKQQMILRPTIVVALMDGI
jgi:hypothetical protein